MTVKLSKKEIEKFKLQLQKLYQELTHSLHSSVESVKSGDDGRGYSQHQADEGTDDFNRTISLELSSKDMEIVRQIERAFEKIEEETYGICDITKEEIPIARLEAIPYANMTVKAQEQVEKGLV